MTSFLSSKQFAFLTIGLLSIPALSPLLPAGFVSTHDGIMHLYRVLELDRTLRSGILYPRWAPDLAYGYGYPIFNFYAPLALYIVEAFHLTFGLGFLPATKLTLGAGLVLSGLSMYLLMVELFEEKSQLKLAAILASLAYIYAPYHLVDIYVRGGVSQSLAFVPMPLILWAFLKFVKVRKLHYLILNALFLASLICVHQIIALFFMPVFFAFSSWVAVRHRKWAFLSYLGLVFMLGLGLSAFYWLPALVELEYAAIDNAIAPGLHFTDHFISMTQPVQTSLFYNYSYDGIAFKLGLVQTGLIIAASIVAFRAENRTRFYRLFFVLVIVVCFALQFPQSEPIWQGLPLVSFVQFPWRLLIFISLSSAILVGSLVLPSGVNHLQRFPEKEKLFTFAVLAALSMLPSLKNIPSERSVFEQDITWAGFHRWERRTFFIGTTSSGEYLPIWVHKEALKKILWSEGQVFSKVGSYEDVLWSETSPTFYRLEPYAIELALQANQAACLSFHIFYFPGWRAYVDDQPAAIEPSEGLGLIQVCVPAGDHYIQLRFEDTPIRTVSQILSLVTTGGVILTGFGSLILSRVAARIASDGSSRTDSAASVFRSSSMAATKR